MKTKLLTTLLALITLPFFAQETPTQQPTQDELLMHLKKVKIEAKNLMQAYNNDLQTIQTPSDDLDENNYRLSIRLLMTLWNNFDEAFDPSGKQALAEAEIYFDLLCNKANTIENLPNNWNNDCLMQTIKLILTIADNTENRNYKQKQQYQLIVSIIAAQLTELKKIDELSTLTLEETVEYLFSGCFCCSPIPVYYLIFKILPHLLPKIEAKIAELKCNPKL